MVALRLGNGKAGVLDEQARLGKYITTQEDEALSLLVEGVVGPLLAAENLRCFVSTTSGASKLKCTFAEVKVNADNNLFHKILWNKALLRIRSTHPAVVIPNPCTF